MLPHFESGENVTDRPPVHTKMALFCRQILETVDFENGTLIGTFWKWYRVNTQNDENRTYFDGFGTRLIDCIGVGSFLWRQSLAMSFYRQISYRFQIFPA